MFQWRDSLISQMCLSKPNFTRPAAITKKIQTFKNYILQGLLWMPLFMRDIFLAIFSDINEVDEKAMQKASKWTLVSSLNSSQLHGRKKVGYSSKKRIHSNQSFAAHERSLNVLTAGGNQLLSKQTMHQSRY